MSIVRERKLFVAADGRLERILNSQCVHVIAVSTSSDETIQLDSSGSLPTTSLQNLRQLKQAVVALSGQTGQDVIVKHNRDTLVVVTVAEHAPPTVSIRWWTMFKNLRLPWLRRILSRRRIEA